MARSTLCSCAAAAAMLAAVAGSQAGFLGSGLAFTEIMVGGGYIDVESMDPFGSELADFIDLADPTPGSHLEMSGADPSFGSLNTGVSFGSFNSDVALFTFWNSIDATPFRNLQEVDAAFAGGRISFTTGMPVLVTLIASVQASEAGQGFFGNYFDDGIEDFFFGPDDNPAFVQFELGPGEHTLGFGSLVPPIGGFASFEGIIAISVIPSPGAVALLGAASVVARRRRR